MTVITDHTPKVEITNDHLCNNNQEMIDKTEETKEEITETVETTETQEIAETTETIETLGIETGTTKTGIVARDGIIMIAEITETTERIKWLTKTVPHHLRKKTDDDIGFLDNN